MATFSQHRSYESDLFLNQIWALLCVVLNQLQKTNDTIKSSCKFWWNLFHWRRSCRDPHHSWLWPCIHGLLLHWFRSRGSTRAIITRYTVLHYSPAHHLLLLASFPLHNHLKMKLYTLISVAFKSLKMSERVILKQALPNLERKSGKKFEFGTNTSGVNGVWVSLKGTRAYP